MSRRFTRLGLIAVAIVAGAVPAMAQGTQTASIAGKVVSADGSPISGVTVTISSPALQQQRTTITSADGNFRAPLLPPGEYRLIFSKSGLESVTLQNRVGLEQGFNPRVVMSATAQATVVVAASSVAADKSEFKTATNFTKDNVDVLPINRGNALDLAYLTPGVQQNINSDKGAVTIRGAQGTGNLVMVDGQNIMDNLYVGQRIQISFDSVEETQVLTGAIPAEYGNIEGGVINQITKIGGNEFSGSLRYDWTNSGWNAVAPFMDRGAFGNNLLEGRSFSLGGPIIKDHLWFFATYFDTHPTHPYDFSIAEYVPDVVNVNGPENDYRHEVKLTFSPNANNTITASYNNSSDAYLRDVAGAGESVALTAFVTKGEFGGVSWSSILNDSLTLFLRAGYKKQTFGSTKSPGYTEGVLYNVGDNYNAYGQTYFDYNDPQADDRRNQTVNGKLSWFLEKAGSHQIDFGFDWYKGTTKASGFQSPGRINIPGVGTNLNLWEAFAADYNPSTTKTVTVPGDPTATPAIPDLLLGPRQGNWTNGTAELDVMKYVPDQLTVATTGLYINDKWAMDNHWLFNIGIRYDSYDAKNQSVGKIASNSSVSPRLGAKYDLFGDTAWVFGAAWNRYQGRPLETIFANAGYSNNPIVYKFFPGEGAVIQTPDRTALAASEFFNIKRYDVTLAPGSYSYTNAAVNVKVDPKLKQQTVDEAQVSATWNFKHVDLGKGFLRVTAVHKTWNNLVDQATGQHGTVTDPIAGTLDYQYWTNDPNAKRTYKDLALDGALNTNDGWAFSANLVWSDLEGNYIGEGRSLPGSGTMTSGLFGTQYANVVGGVVQYDSNALNPSGKLDGGLTVNALGSKSFDNAFGKFILGLRYYHKSGAPYSVSRLVDLSQQYPGTAGNTNVNGNTQFNQYLDGVGTHTFNSQTKISMSGQQDFSAVKVGSYKVVGFLKLAIDNIFNHQQQVNWNIATKASTTTTAEAWSYGGNYGNPTGFANYVAPRSFALSAGIKF